MSNPMKLFIGALLFIQLFPVAACSGSPALAQHISTEVISVEVWRGGDDGLTSKLADALEEKFRQTSPFVVGPASERPSLVVTIPSNVKWKKVGTRTKVQFYVTFSRSSRQIGISKGACWEEDMPRCAAIIVADARKIALR